MKPIAIYFHAVTGGGPRNIDSDYVLNVVHEQMYVLNRSKLLESATEFHVGINGEERDFLPLKILCGPKAQVVCHGAGSLTELPTLSMLYNWLPGHEDWYVFYHHCKGVSTPYIADTWRRRMQANLVDQWKKCVHELDHGKDLCGCHLLNDGRWFFGGNFFWAKAKYLMKLPAPKPNTWENRYEAERWIGEGKPDKIKMRDMFPGWP